MRTATTILLNACMVAAVACGDTVNEPDIGSQYTLSTLDGEPVPAAYDSVFFDGANRFFRVVGGSIDFLSSDSAQYSQATDIVERLSGGELHDWGSDCTSMRVGYQRSGDRIILTIDPNRYLPPGSAAQPVVQDTIVIAESELIQWKRDEPTAAHPDGRSWQLIYREGTPPAPICS